MPASEPAFQNQLPELLEDELELARLLQVTPCEVGTPAFDEAVGKGTIKWAVSQTGSLPVVPKFVNGQEIAHTVLTQGEAVKTAGEAEIVGQAGAYLMLDINNQSGHYQPSADSLEIGKRAFKAKGIAAPV